MLLMLGGGVHWLGLIGARRQRSSDKRYRRRLAVSVYIYTAQNTVRCSQCMNYAFCLGVSSLSHACAMLAVVIVALSPC